MDAAIAREETTEVTAPTVDEAIIIALTRLDLQREEAVIEILDEGRKGILGLGSRPARVRVRRRPPLPVEVPPAKSSLPTSLPPVHEAEPASPTIKTEQAVDKPKTTATPPPPPPPAETSPEPPTAADGSTTSSISEQEAIEAVVLDVIDHLVGALRVRPHLAWHEEERRTLWVTLRGKDDEVLVGPRGKTLDALQYLTRLLVRQHIDSDFNLIVDAGGYRRRRMRSLANLARQMADKAVRTGRPIRLRPMPPGDRRIIHLTLQKDRRVRTHSVGSGEHRAVTISPARHKRKR